MVEYRGYEITQGSIVGGQNISKDGEFVDRVLGGVAEARFAIDQIYEEDGVTPVTRGNLTATPGNFDPEVPDDYECDRCGAVGEHWLEDCQRR